MRLITADLVLCILGLFIPPLPVALKRNVFSADFVINVLLSMLGGIPGVCHSWYIVIKYPDDGIPFFDTRRNQYNLIPDAERQNRQQYQPSQQSGVYGNDNAAAGSSSAPAPPSIDPPPSYGAIPGDNKVQYHQ